MRKEALILLFIYFFTSGINLNTSMETLDLELFENLIFFTAFGLLPFHLDTNHDQYMEDLISVELPEQCKIRLVESIPDGLIYNSTENHLRTYDVR